MQDRCCPFAAIEDHFDEVREKLDEKTHDLASLIETCERELHSLQHDSYSLELQVDNCICKNVIEHTELKRELKSLERDFNSLELKLDNCIFDNVIECIESNSTVMAQSCVLMSTIARSNLVPSRVYKAMKTPISSSRTSRRISNHCTYWQLAHHFQPHILNTLLP